MGCDGGTIPKRDELVTLKKKPEQKDKNADLAAKWKHCAISQEPMQPPIVACQLGRLYKKDKVIEFLLERSKFECAEHFEHIKGLKDVKELQLTENPAFAKGRAEKGDGYTDYGNAAYICPVTGLEMSGTFNFVFLWGCGCVFAERALKNIKTEKCHKCQAPFKKQDVVVLNGNEEEIKQNSDNMEQRRLQAKLAKKEKKKHKLEATTSSSAEASESKSRKVDDSATSIVNGHHSKCTTDLAATSKLNGSSKLNGHGGACGKVDPKSVTSIQKDPKATTAFKSLFTTSEKAKNQPKANWVTYNPFYN